MTSVLMLAAAAVVLSCDSDEEEGDGIGVTATYDVGGVKFKMIGVKAGTFQMGATPEQAEGDDDELPVHTVTLDKFSIGATEVTQELWEAVMGNNPSVGEHNPDAPVNYVSWNQCQQFIGELNRLTGKSFRMPTEAEWEYAARGGQKSEGYRYSGSNDADAVAWHVGNSGGTPHAVATKAANELGLYDMSGNVYEWVFDRYSATYYSVSPEVNPDGATQEVSVKRVFRGGSWHSDTSSIRMAYRNFAGPRECFSDTGLRLAL